MRRTADGLSYELTLKRIKNINIRVSSDGCILVSAPYGTDRSEIDRIVAAKRSFIERALGIDKQPVPEIHISREEAEQRLGKIFRRCYLRFSGCGFAMPQLRIRKMTSQWGNCRKERGIITLNYYLAALDDDCIEFVAVHELSHMLEPNHSDRFYEVMDKYLPNWHESESKLKKLYIPRNKK